MSAPLTKQQHAEWMAQLHDALEAVQGAIKQFDHDDLEETNAYIMGAQAALKRVGDGIDRHDQESDVEFQGEWARKWFREATVLNALVGILPEDDLFREGVYKWQVRHRSIQNPPLKVPEAFDDNKDGPSVTFRVGCNTDFVTVRITAES